MLTMQAQIDVEDQVEESEIEDGGEFDELEVRFGDQSKEEKTQLRADYLDLTRRIEGKFVDLVVLC